MRTPRPCASVLAEPDTTSIGHYFCFLSAQLHNGTFWCRNLLNRLINQDWLRLVVTKV